MPPNRAAVLDSIRKNQIEGRAAELLDSLRIATPDEIAIEDIAMTLGAFVVEGGLRGAEARLLGSSRLSLIRVNQDIRETGRRRFGIAHEIGHLLLHTSTAPLAVCDLADVVLFHAKDAKEIEANCFGAALLMPDKMFRQRCMTASPSLDAVKQLAMEFEVTLTAAATRYIEYCPHRCCMVVSTAGNIRYHRRTADFGYFIQPADEVRSSTYAADLFAGRTIPRGMQSVPATAWLEGSRLAESSRILEHSIAMPSYNSVLTMLWIDKDIDRHVTDDDEAEAEQEASDAHWSWNKYRR